MKWYYWVLLAIVVVLGLWVFYQGKTDMHKKMERVRRAKAEKSALDEIDLDEPEPLERGNAPTSSL